MVGPIPRDSRYSIPDFRGDEMGRTPTEVQILFLIFEPIRWVRLTRSSRDTQFLILSRNVAMCGDEMGRITGAILVGGVIQKWDHYNRNKTEMVCELHGLESGRGVKPAFDFRYLAVSMRNHIWTRDGLLHRAPIGKVQYPAVISVNGSREYWIRGRRHRKSGPAVINRGISREWWHRGLRDRIGAPAVIRDTGMREYWCRGKRHRVGGPAIYYSPIPGIVYTEWWVRGLRHRVGGPAISNRDRCEWWVNGVRHCRTGPAVVLSNGYMEWWIDGVKQDGAPPPVTDLLFPFRKIAETEAGVGSEWWVEKIITESI